MIKHYTADIIFPVVGSPIENGVVSVNQDGKITFIGTRKEADSLGFNEIEILKGAIVPGFVNAHCHLELSHMLGKVTPKSGLVDFLISIMKLRASEEAVIKNEAINADALMFENGIVAVGDISNLSITSSIKETSKIYYHTFIETLGVDPTRADVAFERALAIKEAFKHLPKSLVPHAPYSVSQELFQLLAEYGEQHLNIFSIHNQESEQENQLFESGDGDFLKLYEFLNTEIPRAVNFKKRPIETYLPYLNKQTTVLVHNTYLNSADLKYAKKAHNDLYFCLCPAANLYIEDKLPDVQMLQHAGVKLVIGTDSLASNHTLNILEEMLILQQFSEVSLVESLVWATINGAKLLNVEDRLGSIEIGKSPGLNLISVDSQGKILNNKVRRLV